jgi:transcriptional regulator with XRE-family HTH domain
MTDNGERAEGMQDVGPALRRIREEKGLLLTAVAQEAGITKGFLSLAERGRTRVSVPTLLRICEVLDISIGSLFTYPSEQVIHGGTPLYMGGADMDEFLLTPAGEPLVQVMRSVMRPGGGSGGAYTLDAETIFVIVQYGQLELEIDGATILLGPGDATTFSPRLPHTWRNPLPTVSEVLWVIAPPLAHD